MKKLLLVGVLLILALGLLAGGVAGAAALVQRYRDGSDLAREGTQAVVEVLESAVEQIEPLAVDESQVAAEGQTKATAPSERGVLLLGVTPESPAAGVGLRRGDIILAVDGEEVDSPIELREAIREIEPGTTVTLLVLRCEEPEEMEVVLGEAADQEDAYLGVSLLPPLRGDLSGHLPEMGEFEFEREFAFGPGALVQEVIEDSPAATAGLQAGDRIMSVDGEAVTLERPLPAIIRSFSIGDLVNLEFERDGESMTLEATLAEHPEEEGVAFLGVRLANFAVLGQGPHQGELPHFPRLNLEHLDFGEGVVRGAVIQEVVAGSAAEAAGLKEGDLIESLDGETLEAPDDLGEMIADHAPGDVIELAVRRDGEELILTAVLDESPEDETAAYLGVTTRAFVHLRMHDGNHELDELWHEGEIPFTVPHIEDFQFPHRDFDFDWLEEIDPEHHLEIPSPIWFAPGPSEV